MESIETSKLNELEMNIVSLIKGLKDILCAKCKKVDMENIKLTPCGHIFCKDCLPPNLYRTCYQPCNTDIKDQKKVSKLCKEYIIYQFKELRLNSKSK